MEAKLLALQAELKTHFEKAAEQQAKHGTISEELRTKINAVQKQVDAIDSKLAARETLPGEEADSFENQMKNDPGVQRLL